MRFLSLIITLLIIGVLIYKQLGTESPEPGQAVNSSNSDVPKVPTNPGEVREFEKDINAFVLENAEETAKKIEEAEGGN